jgi:hypothetical protein
MDTDVLVTSHIDDGRRLLEQLDRDRFPVSVAFWVKRSEEGSWRLYIASPSFDQERFGESYRNLYASLDRLKGLSDSVSPASISLTTDTSTIAKDAQDIRDRYPSRNPVGYRGERLGDLSIYEAQIYQEVRPIRLSFTVAYYRQGETNNWRATIERGVKYEGINFKGVMGYSTAQWEGETAGQEKLGTVTVLLEMDPSLGDKDILDPEVQRVVTNQARIARKMADEMFKSRHPEAVIETDDNE